MLGWGAVYGLLRPFDAVSENPIFIVSAHPWLPIWGRPRSF